MENNSHHVGAGIPHPVESQPSGSPGGFEPSARLGARIEKLAAWRISPSSITFPERARKFRGGHATVSEANLDRSELEIWGGVSVVAVKNPMIADDIDFGQALGLAIREAEFLAELSHRNVVGFEGFVEDASKSVIWLIFPWADNGNLKDFISLVDWEIPERISLIHDVAQGLAYLHSRDPPICHGDLKSLNVLVDLDCHAAITDFGSARRLPQRDPNTQVKQRENISRSPEALTATYSASTNTITLTGNKYTLRWAAPELLNEDRLSLRSDIWALGWIAYEVMTNFIPFQDSSTDIVVVERVLAGKLPSLTADLWFVKGLCSLMNECWQNNPKKRPTAGSCRVHIGNMRKVIPAFEFKTTSRNSGSRIRSTELLGELGYIHQSHGEYARAFEFFTEALEISRSFEPAEKTVSSLCDLAQLHRCLGEYAKAMPLYSEALKISTDFGDRPGRANALGGLAALATKNPNDSRSVFFEVWDFPQTRYSDSRLGNPLYCEARSLYSTARTDPESKVDAIRGLALVALLRGEYKKAIALYSETLGICSAPGNREGKVSVLWGLAVAYGLQGEYNKAVLLYAEALNICAARVTRQREARTQWGFNWADLLRTKFEDTVDMLIYFEQQGSMPLDPPTGCYDRDGCSQVTLFRSETVKIRKALKDRHDRANALWALAQVHRLRGEYDEAIPLYSEALEICTALGDKRGRVGALCGLAVVYRLQGKCNEAIPICLETLEICTTLGDRQGRANALWDLAAVYRIQGEYNKTISLYSEASEIHNDLGNRAGKADALCGLADVHRLLGEYDRAIRLYSSAMEIFTNLGDRQGRSETILRHLRLLRIQVNHESPVRWRSRILLPGLGNRRRSRLQLPKPSPTWRNV